MKSVKDAGAAECKRLRNRIGRALGTQAISQEDHDYMRARIDEIESRIEEMDEIDPKEVARGAARSNP